MFVGSVNCADVREKVAEVKNCLEKLAVMYYTNGHYISFLETLTYLANRRTAIRTGHGTQNEQLAKPVCKNWSSIYFYFSPKLRYQEPKISGKTLKIKCFASKLMMMIIIIIIIIMFAGF
jgi:hypothetical protein